MSILPSLKKAPLRGFFALCILLSSVSAYAGNCCAVATAHPLATQAGIDILEQGGNAFDAAVTVSAVLAVVEPYSSGIGGGGFWLLRRAADGYQVMLDGRETAPQAATPDLFLDDAGQPVKNLSINGALAAGIPGQPAALVHLSEKYGRLSLQQSLQPAIDLAREGFAVDEYYRKMARWRLSALQDSFAASDIFLHDDDIPRAGYRIVQKDLANTLQLLARHGHAGFYQGETAEKLVSAVQQANGIWQLSDLQNYKVIEREPVVFNFRGYRITTASLPSSGGIVMAQILNMLSHFDWSSLSVLQQKHLQVEAMRRAYSSRARFLGDSDFVDVPVDRLLSESLARKQALGINSKKASKSDASVVEHSEGMDTTHFSIMDAQGNLVSATLSINYPFGSGFVAPGTGVLLNDEMDDFSAAPGVANVYGLVGNEANAIAPGKRMLSSMTPTFVESEDSLALIGTPGGSRIISMVTRAVLAMQASDDPQQWVDMPRFHHQFLPDVIEYETDAFSDAEIAAMKLMGHAFREQADGFGNMQAVYLNKNSGDMSAASDHRGIGAAMVK